MELFYLFLGWLLGMLSPLIVNRINRSYSKRELLDGLNAEIKDCQFRVILAAHMLGSQYGIYDRKFLEWCLPYLERYQGTESNEDAIKIVKKFLGCSDKDIEDFTVLLRQKEKGLGRGLKKYYLPFLESKISEISCFSIELQTIIYEIRARLQIVNEEIESAIKYFYMTFDSNISDDNHVVIKKDLAQKYINLQGQLIILVKKMDNSLNYENKI